MARIKVKFVNQGHVEREQSRVFRVLRDSYDYVIDNDNPDYVLCGPHQTVSLAPYKDKIVIFETCEAVTPDFNLVDYAIGFDNISFGDRYFQMPMSLADWNPNRHETTSKTSDLINRLFCNFLYSNPKAHPIRDDFFFYLSDKYKTVDSLGRHLNNVKKRHSRHFDTWTSKEMSKLEILSNYKFTIAFENARHTGYVSEKILHSFEANSIPIYWGNPKILDYFNENSFIWVKDRRDFDSAIERIEYLDENDQAYLTMLNASPLNIDLKELVGKEDAFIRNIFDQDLKSARRRAEGTFLENFYLRVHNEIYVRRWHKLGIIRKSQIWHELRRVASIFGLDKILRPLGKRIRHLIHR